MNRGRIERGVVKPSDATEPKSISFNALIIAQPAAGEEALGQAPDDSEGERDNRPHQTERALDGDSDQAEGQQQQPNEGVEDQRQQSKRPAQQEEKAPQQKGEHNGRLCLKYESGAGEVPRGF